MHWSPAAVAAATEGLLLPGTGRGTPLGREGIDGVTIDSRRVAPGALFVPIRAERDGHEFVPAAVAAGAGAYLVEHGVPPCLIREEVPGIEVADTRAALLALGAAARRRLAGPVIGITGSVGKTSTKDLAAAALATAWRTTASERSFNNELGVPLTLANAPDGTEVTVVEMGARGRGHIASLCRVAQPTIAVVTAVAAAHTEQFGDLDAVEDAKAELVQTLASSGTAILNADDRRVARMAHRTAAEVLRYSALGDPTADVVARDVTLDDDVCPAFVLSSPWGDTRVRLRVHGAHQVGNALAAAAVALRCDVPIAAVAEGLGQACVSPWRMELRRGPTGAVVVNDAYNANPASMTAALQALAALPARRRLAVLGPMAELGDASAASHRAVAELADRLRVVVLAVGTDAYGFPPFADLDEVVNALGPLEAGDAVLIKGSRVAGLERLADRLVGEGGAGA